MTSSRRSPALVSGPHGRGPAPILVMALAVLAVWLLPLGTAPTRSPVPAPAPAAAAATTGPVAAPGATQVELTSTLVTCAPRLRGATTAGVESDIGRAVSLDLGGGRARPERPHLILSQLAGTGCTNRGPPAASVSA